MLAVTVMGNHPIKKGDNGGKFQCSSHRGVDPRYLLDDKKVHKGPQGGHYQQYGRGKKRYLLEY